MNIQLGDTVNHRNYDELVNGVIQAISESGESAYVVWPKSEKLPKGHWAMYGLTTLIKVKV